MAPTGHPGPAGTAHQRAPARQTATGARRVALFASGPQLSDAPTAEMAAEAATATVRRFGIHGCVSRMAQEFGDHPDAAAERMRWICQLAAEMPARPQMPAGTGRASSRAGKELEPRSDHRGAAAGFGARPRVLPRSTAAGGAT
jgi:hypothetical protein